MRLKLLEMRTAAIASALGIVLAAGAATAQESIDGSADRLLSQSVPELVNPPDWGPAAAAAGCCCCSRC